MGGTSPGWLDPALSALSKGAGQARETVTSAHRLGLVPTQSFSPITVIEELIKYEYFICFGILFLKLFFFFFPLSLSLSFVFSPSYFFPVIPHACVLLQEMAMESYLPGHGHSFLKRQLYWNKS